MPARRPKWLTGINEQPSTRARSKKQETNLAKQLKGRMTINSGATFGENDVVTDFAEIEAKTTEKNSFSVKMTDWDKLRTKCNIAKIPVMVVQFEQHKKQLAVVSYDDLLYLIKQANSVE